MLVFIAPIVKVINYGRQSCHFFYIWCDKMFWDLEPHLIILWCIHLLFNSEILVYLNHNGVNNSGIRIIIVDMYVLSKFVTKTQPENININQCR